MKAEEVIKKEKSIDFIYKDIEAANNRGDFRIAIPPFQCISNDTILQLIADGFKCYSIKDFSGLSVLIVEW